MQTFTYLFDDNVLVTGVVAFTITETWVSTEGLGSRDAKGVNPLAGLDMLEGVAEEVGVGKPSGTGGGNTSITVTCSLYCDG